MNLLERVKNRAKLARIRIERAILAMKLKRLDFEMWVLENNVRPFVWFEVRKGRKEIIREWRDGSDNPD